MSKTKISELALFDPANFLENEAVCKHYLAALLEAGDMDAFFSGLGDVAKARGMTAIAEASGLGRESLYKAFAPGKQPKFETVYKVAKAAGLQITIV
jgi:probable addiction module antidote protein